MERHDRPTPDLIRGPVTHEHLRGVGIMGRRHKGGDDEFDRIPFKPKRL